MIISLIHKLSILLNKRYLIILFYIIIGTMSCQQQTQQPDKKVPQQQLQTKETSSIQKSTTKENSTMAFYLTRFSYTPETWARMMKNPEDRSVAARKYIESVGGKLHGFWYAFGEYDGYCLWEAPDKVSMAAVGLAITGGGALSKFETTPLLTVEETLDALRRAQKVSYTPPGAK